MKSSQVYIKTRSPPASPPIQGQVNKHTTVKWPILSSGDKVRNKPKNCHHVTARLCSSERHSLFLFDKPGPRNVGPLSSGNPTEDVLRGPSATEPGASCTRISQVISRPGCKRIDYCIQQIRRYSVDKMSFHQNASRLGRATVLDSAAVLALY